MLTLISGFDANTTLPMHADAITGNCICRPMKSHGWNSRYKILEWMRSLGLRALNTFGDGAPNWTCGRSRPPGARSMIDYVGISPNLVGSVEVTTEDLEGMGNADHRPLWAELKFAGDRCALKQRLQETKRPSLKGWKPRASKDLEEFQVACLHLMSTPLDCLERQLLQIATAVDYTTLALERLEQRQLSREGADVTKHCGTKACDATAPEYVRRAKAAKRQSRRVKWNRQLKQLSADKADAQRTQITSMRIDGELSFDRELWVLSAAGGERHHGRQDVLA